MICWNFFFSKFKADFERKKKKKKKRCDWQQNFWNWPARTIGWRYKQGAGRAREGRGDRKRDRERWRKRHRDRQRERQRGERQKEYKTYKGANDGCDDRDRLHGVSPFLPKSIQCLLYTDLSCWPWGKDWLSEAKKRSTACLLYTQRPQRPEYEPWKDKKCPLMNN